MDDDESKPPTDQDDKWQDLSIDEVESAYDERRILVLERVQPMPTGKRPAGIGWRNEMPIDTDIQRWERVIKNGANIR